MTSAIPTGNNASWMKAKSMSLYLPCGKRECAVGKGVRSVCRPNTYPSMPCGIPVCHIWFSRRRGRFPPFSHENWRDAHTHANMPLNRRNYRRLSCNPEDDERENIELDTSDSRPSNRPKRPEIVSFLVFAFRKLGVASVLYEFKSN